MVSRIVPPLAERPDALSRSQPEKRRGSDAPRVLTAQLAPSKRPPDSAPVQAVPSWTGLHQQDTAPVQTVPVVQIRSPRPSKSPQTSRRLSPGSVGPARSAGTPACPTRSPLPQFVHPNVPSPAGTAPAAEGSLCQQRPALNTIARSMSTDASQSIAMQVAARMHSRSPSLKERGLKSAREEVPSNSIELSSRSMSVPRPKSPSGRTRTPLPIFLNHSRTDRVIRVSADAGPSSSPIARRVEAVVQEPHAAPAETQSESLSARGTGAVAVALEPALVPSSGSMHLEFGTMDHISEDVLVRQISEILTRLEEAQANLESERPGPLRCGRTAVIQSVHRLLEAYEESQPSQEAELKEMLRTVFTKLSRMLHEPPQRESPRQAVPAGADPVDQGSTQVMQLPVWARKAHSYSCSPGPPDLSSSDEQSSRKIMEGVPAAWAQTQHAYPHSYLPGASASHAGGLPIFPSDRLSSKSWELAAASDTSPLASSWQPSSWQQAHGGFTVWTPRPKQTPCSIPASGLMPSSDFFRRARQALDLQEYLNGDPWDGCEDIAREDLIEWFADSLQLAAEANRKSKEIGGVGNLLASCLKPERHHAIGSDGVREQIGGESWRWQDPEDVGSCTVRSFATASTQSSFGGAQFSTPSSDATLLPVSSSRPSDSPHSLHHFAAAGGAYTPRAGCPIFTRPADNAPDAQAPVSGAESPLTDGFLQLQFLSRRPPDLLPPAQIPVNLAPSLSGPTGLTPQEDWNELVATRLERYSPAPCRERDFAFGVETTANNSVSQWFPNYDRNARTQLPMFRLATCRVCGKQRQCDSNLCRACSARAEHLPS
mmetsp:Transcript_43879/g.82353  ORF Transcript_43879/g.82353 Transcript_43879/m.82353 type:complete len:827 (-) Transcript_43879:113-2593(-)